MKNFGKIDKRRQKWKRVTNSNSKKNEKNDEKYKKLENTFRRDFEEKVVEIQENLVKKLLK